MSSAANVSTNLEERRTCTKIEILLYKVADFLQGQLPSNLQRQEEVTILLDL